MKKSDFFGVSLGLVPLKILGPNFVKDICKGGKLKQHCRYYSEEIETGGPACLKLTDHKKVIDDEVERFLKLVDDNHSMPVGDNCLGCAPPIGALLN